MPRRIRLPHSKETHVIPDHEMYALMQVHIDAYSKARYRTRYEFRPIGHPHQNRVRVESWREEECQYYSEVKKHAPLDLDGEKVRDEEVDIGNFLVSQTINKKAPDHVDEAWYMKRIGKKYTPPPYNYPSETGRIKDKKLMYESMYGMPVKKRGQPMDGKEFPVGTRVEFISEPNGKQEICKGTVVTKGPRTRGTVVVLHDDSYVKLVARGKKLGMNALGLPADMLQEVPLTHLSRLNSSDYSVWASVPKFVGVIAKSSFIEGSCKFRAGAHGRILRFEDDYVEVAWSHSDPSFRTGAVGEDFYDNVWSVPKSRLRIVTLHSESGDPLHSWPEFPTACRYKEGDVVVYRGPKPHKVEGRRRMHGITNGAVLRVGMADNRNCIVQPLSGVSESILGNDVRIPTEYLQPLDHEFFDTESKVEVVAEVVFRRQDLKGQRGVVVIPTDSDGDVGIQFESDVKGGNLDGAGKDGRCLYVSAGALKVSK